MHSALFVIKVKNPQEDWVDFESKLRVKLEPRGREKQYAESCERLAENVWLLDVTKSAAPLGWLIGFSEAHGYSYGILPFDKKPEWLPTSFSP